ncbi:Protein HEXIM [Trichinella pseudospiralis]|uniref:Protein HEXIM n=1 Tax=Trichinella pseudospiralis TaxID=6337 RepID=A0A0V0YPI9_TRIPS|nr:Protein HEXIM [Trichinella pseudospiralis]KRY79382.1 Protein HEXIM [Trichinella pseudospiralis]KRZ34272.1 Protein HEXIM [Trichinella pseudospiralis]KRZ45560.1 Protein HEXIM [Trichinella pseudospiralis]
MQTDDNEGLSFSSGKEARSSILTHPDGEQGAAVGEQFQSVAPSCDRTENSPEVVSYVVVEAGGSSESRGDDTQLEATAGKPKRKKRTRRPVRRPWKPYFKLSLEERQRLELREERRAERIRAQRFAHGLPVAPYNTTQFLLDDREARESEPICVDEIVDTIRHQGAVNDHHGRQDVPNHHHHHHHHHQSDHLVVGDEYSSDSVTTSEGDLCMLEREFDYEYETAHAERLEEMSKEQLVQEYIHLEKELERYQSESAQLRSAISELAKRCSTCGHNDIASPRPPPPPRPQLVDLANGEEQQQNAHQN